MLSSLRASRLRNLNNLGSVEERYPKDDKGIYNQYYGRILNHYKKLIEEIYQTAGCPIIFPVGTELIEKYLTGYELRYFAFDKYALGIKEIEGWWEWDTYESGVVNIFYNQNTVEYRQHFTKIHETLHFCQSLDNEFRQLLDEIIKNKVLPPEMVERLVERITEKTTAVYLMPEEQVIKTFEKNKNVLELANTFRVSMQTAMYRLKECGILLSG
jgi:hypothetical protein